MVVATPRRGTPQVAATTKIAPHSPPNQAQTGRAFAAVMSTGSVTGAARLLAGCDQTPQVSDPATSGVTDAMLASPPAEEWLTYGRDMAEQRFSPLDAINADNVSTLGLAWSADLDTARGQEATPLMHDGVLYVSTAWSMVKAYDAKTGALKWSYDPEVPRETLAVACCESVNRGVALDGDKAHAATKPSARTARPVARVSGVGMAVFHAEVDVVLARATIHAEDFNPRTQAIMNGADQDFTAFCVFLYIAADLGHDKSNFARICFIE